MEHQIITAWAQVAATVVIGLGQLGMIGWGLRRWEKDTDELRKQNEKRRAEQAERAAEWAEISQGLKDTSRMLGEALAQSQARWARS